MSEPGETSLTESGAELSMAEFKRMADRAGLGMSEQEVAELKPVYDLYAAYAQQLHEISFGATEMAVEFHADRTGS